MNQLEYLPGIAGQSVQLDGPSAFVGIAEEMRSREWDYDLGYRDLVTATRPARKVDVTFNADYATADYLRRVADADVMARTPGTFVAQKEWKQRGYILASDVDDIHYGRLSTSLKIALLDGAWWRLVKRSFVPEITTPEYRSATGETVTASGASGAPLHALTVDGKAVQDGTPTPDAPVEIRTVSGVNLLKANPEVATNNGIRFEALADGRVSVRGTATAQVDFFISTLSIGKNPIYVPVGSYTFAANGLVDGVKAITSGGGNNGFAYTELTPTNAHRTSTVTDATKPFNYFVLRIASGTVVDTVISVSLTSGAEVMPYIPYGSIGLSINGVVTPIHLQGNVLASLPDGTHDELNVDSNGAVAITKRVGYTNQATTDGISATVGTDAISSTGTLDDGADVYYKLITEQTITLTSITMPAVPLDAQISVMAAVTPTITAEWQISRDAYLDYPHDYPHDYQETSYTGGITPSVLTPSDVYLVVYGPAVNPYVIVGGNRYQVNVTVPAGGYLIVDGRDKTINMTLADGTVQNVFSSGVRGGGAGGGSYIFERVPAGTSEVTYDGSFGFDLGWYEEEGEPPWSQS